MNNIVPKYKLVRTTTGEVVMFGDDPTVEPGIYKDGIMYDIFADGEVEWQPMIADDTSEQDNLGADNTTVVNSGLKLQIMALEAEQHRKVREWIIAEEDEVKADLRNRLKIIDSQIQNLREQMML